MVMEVSARLFLHLFCPAGMLLLRVMEFPLFPPLPESVSESNRCYFQYIFCGYHSSFFQTSLMIISQYPSLEPFHPPAFHLCCLSKLSSVAEPY